MRYKYHWLGLAFLALGIVRLWIYARHGKHFLWLVPLLLAVSASGHVLNVNNLSGTNLRLNFVLIFPPGLTRIEETPSFVSAWNTCNPIQLIEASRDYSIFYCEDGVIYIFGDSIADDDVESSLDYGIAVAAGIGVGFLWFGFGWCYRLGRKIPDC